MTNPADRSRSWTGPMLVDTGATDSVVPRPILGAIGVVPESTRTYELADGTQVELDIATARIELMGELTAGLVVFGGAEVEPLLGVTALESVGVEVDPRNQRLTKLSAVRLKGTRTTRKQRGEATEKPDRLEAYRRILMLLARLEPIEFPVSSIGIPRLASKHGYKDIASIRDDFISLYCQHLGEKGYVEIGSVRRYISQRSPKVQILHVTSVGYDVAELDDDKWSKITKGVTAALPFAKELAIMLPQLLSRTT